MQQTIVQHQKYGGFAPRRQYESQYFGHKPASNDMPNQSKSFQEIHSPQSVLQPQVNVMQLQLKKNLRMQNTNGLVMKTPVSILQEILSRRSITPNYELVQIEGAIHEPTFWYLLSFNDKDAPCTAMGAECSKKEAKHSAARALINKLTGLQLPYNTAQPYASEGVREMNNNQSSLPPAEGEDKVVGNPIGWLQDICMTRRWPRPTYIT